MFEVDFALASLHYVHMGNVAIVLKVYAASVFNAEVIRLGKLSCICGFWSKRSTRVRVGTSAQTRPIQPVWGKALLGLWSALKENWQLVFQSGHTPVC